MNKKLGSTAVGERRVAGVASRFGRRPIRRLVRSMRIESSSLSLSLSLRHHHHHHLLLLLLHLLLHLLWSPSVSFWVWLRFWLKTKSSRSTCLFCWRWSTESEFSLVWFLPKNQKEKEKEKRKSIQDERLGGPPFLELSGLPIGSRGRPWVSRESTVAPLGGDKKKQFLFGNKKKHTKRKNFNSQLVHRFKEVLLGFTGFYWVLLGFYWVLLGFT